MRRTVPEFHLIAEDVLRYPFGELTYSTRELTILEQKTEHASTKADDTGTAAERIHGV